MVVRPRAVPLSVLSMSVMRGEAKVRAYSRWVGGQTACYLPSPTDPVSTLFIYNSLTPFLPPSSRESTSFSSTQGLVISCLVKSCPAGAGIEDV